MFHFLKVMAVVGLTTFLSTALLFASIGTPGGNGLVPYIDISSTMVDQDVTFTVMNVASDFPTEPYYFLFSTEHYPNGGWCFPEFGYGAVILPNIGSGYGAIQVYNENPISFFIPPEAAGWTYTCQAIIPDTGAKNGLCFSQPLEFTFMEHAITNFDDLHYEIIGCVPHVGDVYDVAFKDPYVYVASATFGLCIVESKPGATPEFEIVGMMKDYTTESLQFKHVGTNGKVALLVNGAGKCWIMNVSDPGNISKVGELTCSQNTISDLVVHEDRAFAISYTKKTLEVFDISDVQNVHLLGTKYLTVPPFKIANLDQYLMILHKCGASSTLCVYEYDQITSNLIQKESYPIQSSCVDFSLSSNKFVMLDYINHKIEIFDSAGLPNILQSKIGEYDGIMGQKIVVGENDLACVHNYSNHSVTVVNLAGSTSVYPITLNAPCSANGMVISGSFCYLAAGEATTDPSNSGGLCILDLENKAFETDLEFNGAYEIYSDLEIFSDSLAFVAFNGQGIYAVDISDKTNPRLASHLPLPDNFIVLEKFKDHLCYAKKGTLIIASVGSGGVLTTIGEYNDVSFLRDIKTYGDYLYLSEMTSNGLEIIDASDVAKPVHVNTYDELGGVTGMEVQGNNLYGSFCNANVALLDISNPANPIALSIESVPNQYAFDIVVTSSFMYGANVLNDALFAIDCSDMWNIKFDGSYTLPNSSCNGIEVMSNVLVCSHMLGGDGIGIKYSSLLDIGDNSLNTTQYNADNGYHGRSCSIKVYNNLLFMANDCSLLSIYELTDSQYPD